MSLYTAVSSVHRSTLPLLSDGAVTFHFPPATLSTNAGVVAVPVLRATYNAGTTLITIDDANGNGLHGDIPSGSTVTIGGNSYTVKDAEPALGGLSFVVTPGLVAQAVAGTAVSFSSTPVQIANSLTSTADTARDRDFREHVTFAFQYHVSDYAGRPLRGTRCVRTTASGAVLTGNVLDTDSGGIMVTVWCGGTTSP